MWRRTGGGGASDGKFFRTQLITNDSIKELLKQSFILVYKVGLNLEDVNKMTAQERRNFFEFLAEDVEAHNDILKRN
jgi:hypothetical protein